MWSFNLCQSGTRKQFWINQKMGHTICVNQALVNIFSLRYSIQGPFLANVEATPLDMLGNR